MENSGGVLMVKNNVQKVQIPELIITDAINLPEEELRWSTVSLSEILKQNTRFEASVFDIEVKHAREVLKICKYDVVNLYGSEGFIDNAFYPGRFKRAYVNKNDDNTIGFLGSSEMLFTRPKPIKFLSENQNDIQQLKLKSNTILLSRSGTIGNVAFVSNTLEKYLISEHAIRIICKEFSGYVYAYLKTKIGKTLVITNTYGAVVNQIEPEHLKNILIPNPPIILKKQIHDLIVESHNLQDEANSLIDKAEKLLIEELKLPAIEDLKLQYYENKEGLRNYSTKLSALNARFDGSYHIPLVDSILKHISANAKEVINIRDSRISNEIILPGRFKRVYVEEGQGTVFLGGKQLYELDPSNKKYLSLQHHGERIKEELSLKENMILITRSGTIGKINITPKHWEKWVMNEHVIRVIPKNNDIAGYIYCWLNSDYGYELIKRFTYGAVVDEIDTNHVSQISIPILKNQEIQKQINDLVLDANQKRYEAYIAEQKAIKIVNDKVIHAEKEL
jgi:type I restriction enzyme S subunit